MDTISQDVRNDYMNYGFSLGVEPDKKWHGSVSIFSTFDVNLTVLLFFLNPNDPITRR